MFREQTSGKRIAIWNAAGSAVYALSSFLLLIIVTRICGESEGGVFSIGYAIAQLMLTIGVFECTTYMATDASNRFTYEQYLGFKILTCVLMVVVSIVYIFSFGFDVHKEAVAFALCFYRLFEALANYWFAAFQKEERLDIAGFSTVWRSIISIVLFASWLAVTNDVVGAMIAASISEAIWIAAYDIPRLRKIVVIRKPDFSIKPIMLILLACLPLFISSFLATYLGNVCKYAIEAVGTDQMQVVFNILFMPSFVINLFMIFFIRPTLTKLAKLWEQRNVKPFMRIIGRLLVLVVAITAIVIVCCALFGIPLLEWIYSINLQGQEAALIAIMIGGGFLSASNVYYNAMIVIRAQVGILIGYAICIVIATLLATPLVTQYEIMGASSAYTISCLVLFVLFIVIFAIMSRMKQKKWELASTDGTQHVSTSMSDTGTISDAEPPTSFDSPNDTD